MMLKSIALFNEVMRIMVEIIRHDKLFAFPIVATLFDYVCESLGYDKEEALQEFETMVRNVNERYGAGFPDDYISS